MLKFDCLDPKTPLWGPHLLEASAGTGKTFAIEHIVARLLTDDAPVALNEILVVTFTRAATRELKWRIRKNLEKLLDDEASPWPYWDPEKKDSRRLIEGALATFEESQIYTIHGFCARMLQEFALETPFQMGEELSSKAMEAAARDFFEFLSETLVSPEQLNLILGKMGSVEALALALQKGELEGKGETFGELLELFSSAAKEMPAGDLAAEFEVLRNSYKKEVKGDLEGQIRALERASIEPRESFGKLIEEKGTLFSFLGEDNKKKGALKKALPSPSFSHKIQWCQDHLLPLIQRVSDPVSIFNTLLAAWKPIEKEVLLKEGGARSDDLLWMMREAVQNKVFRESLQSRYKAVLIDEFQDTDPTQWDIFKTLFLGEAKAIYLIGDPKQSIYRFRKADLYTYFSARDSMGIDSHFYLDTNYRSSKELIGALNQLFDRSWLQLPKLKKELPYLPMKAGLDLSCDLKDGKKALHCLLFEKEEDLFSYIAKEILLLKDKVSSLNSFAVLVKDRYGAQKIEQMLAKAGILTQTKSRESLCDTLAFEAVEELFEALRRPRDLAFTKGVLAGPFFKASREALKTLAFTPLLPLLPVLEQKGLALAMRSLLDMEWEGKRVSEIVNETSPFYADFCQLLEILFAWERTTSFTLDGVLAHLKEIKRAEGEEAIYRQKGAEGSAVQIMTMHVSKGLEFDIVFCLGLAARTPAVDEEGEAEKLRQFYVAMTRAKYRCYLPFPSGWKTPLSGTASPVELFCRRISEEELFKMESVSIEKVDSSAPIPMKMVAPSNLPQNNVIQKRPLPTPSYLLSFTALAKASSSSSSVVEVEELAEGYTPHTLPRGAEIGLLIHEMFERIFSEPNGWKSHSWVEQLIQDWPLSEKIAPWRGAIVEMVQQTLDLPLPYGFCLRQIEAGAVLTEVEFLFEDAPNWVKGFMDLLFSMDGQYYILDWKTNWLGSRKEAYTEARLQEAIGSNQYDLQASLYATAVQRVLGASSREEIRAIYCFVRAPSVFCFQPLRYHGF